MLTIIINSFLWLLIFSRQYGKEWAGKGNVLSRTTSSFKPRSHKIYKGFLFLIKDSFSKANIKMTFIEVLKLKKLPNKERRSSPRFFLPCCVVGVLKHDKLSWVCYWGMASVEKQSTIKTQPLIPPLQPLPVELSLLQFHLTEKCSLKDAFVLQSITLTFQGCPEKILLHCENNISDLCGYK